MNILKKGAIIAVTAIFLSAGTLAGYAASENTDNEIKVLTKEELEESEEAGKVISVNNANCPVSEDEIDKNTCIKVEYKGKIYNLCCPACIKHFKIYPDKFAQKAEANR